MAYCDRAFLEALFASSDVAKWADRNNTLSPSEIDANVTEALDQASSDIDDRLRGGPYVVPFESPAPRFIKDLCRKLAACILYGPRGAQDTDVNGMPFDRLSAIRNEVDAKLRMIRAGQVRLNVSEYMDIPVVYPVPLERDSDLA